MKKYEFSFSANWVFDAPIKNHHFLLHCMPGTYPFQRTYAHSLTVSPSTAITMSTDGYGNQTYSGSIEKAHSSFSFSVTGFVLCSKYIIHEPLDPFFLYPSIFTQPSDDMRLFLAGLDLPSDPAEKARRLAAVVHEYITYIPNSTAVDTMASQSFAMKRGVSRDFVHVYITLCRLAKIPARYVIGLAKGVTRSHVWAEVYCNNVWQAMDPTLGKAVEEGYLKIAHGMDYADCAVDRYSYKSIDSNVRQAKTVSAKVTDHLITGRDTVPRA